MTPIYYVPVKDRKKQELLSKLKKTRRCPREGCGGNLALEKNVWGDAWLKCIQCGRRHYLKQARFVPRRV